MRATSQNLFPCVFCSRHSHLPNKTINSPTDGVKPCQIFGKMVLKEGADKEALAAALKAYGDASAAAPGQLACSYGIADDHVIMFETMDSINAMDIHVGHCFPHFVKMLPHCEMDTLIGTCDKSELEYWTAVCNAWGAKTAACHVAI